MITMKMKDAFFDRKAVIDAVGKARASVLGKAGAFIRRTARTLARFRKRVSKPGEPPSTHTRNESASLRNIPFFFDDRSKSVVVGPVRLTSTKSASFTPTVPNVLEFGGTVQRFKFAPNTTGRRATPAQATAFRRKVTSGQIVIPKRQKVAYSATYQKRPLMVPARDANISKIPELWRDSVVKAA